jgi:hypothetical protein
LLDFYVGCHALMHVQNLSHKLIMLKFEMYARFYCQDSFDIYQMFDKKKGNTTHRMATLSGVP